MQFTDIFVKKLPITETRYDKREANGQGFAIRVAPSGKKTWTFFYHFEGKKRRMDLGNYPELPLVEARKKHQASLALLAKNIDPGIDKTKRAQAARAAPTVADLVMEYMEIWAKPRKRSWKEDERLLNKDVLPAWGRYKAKDVTRRDVVLLLDTINERGSPIIANRTFAVIRRMFNFAVERDIIPTTPCQGVKAPAKENRRDRVLSFDELKTFWHMLPKASMALTTQLALKLQLVTAQRKGEVISAEWHEFDLTEGYWHIPAEKSKNNNPHRIPLSTLAIALLEELKGHSSGSPWLFPSPTTSSCIAPTTIDHALRKNLVFFSEVQAFTPHDLRRTAASHMTGLGIPRLVVSKILNHSDNSVTAIYDRHSYDKEKKDALEAWAMQLNTVLDGSRAYALI